MTKPYISVTKPYIPVAMCLLVCLLAVSPVFAGDWPMWRGTASRSAAVDGQLPAKMHLQWVREFPQLTPAWSGELDINFDATYEPIVIGELLVVGSSRNDSVSAYDTRTGEHQWTFHAGGPVRFAPVAAEGKVYFASDDGRLYCITAADGELVWKFDGALADNKSLGNGRLISAWPARGGPVLADGKVYFAAGIWPFMGVSIYAIDAETGKTVWINDSSDFLFSSDQFVWARNEWVPSADGVSPQGYLVATRNRLLVPCGRSKPAVFDRHTGRLLYAHSGGKGRHTSMIAATEEYFFAHNKQYDLETGEGARSATFIPQLRDLSNGVFTEDAIYIGGVSVIDVSNAEIVENTKPAKKKKPFVPQAKDIEAERVEKLARNTHHWKAAVPSYWSRRFASPSTRHTRKFKKLWSSSAGKGMTVRIKAGGRLYFAGPGAVAAMKIPSGRKKPSVSWRAKIEGNPTTLLAADDRLFVVTDGGKLYCFGGEKVTQPITHAPKAAEIATPQDQWAKKAGRILAQTKVTQGYCLVLGAGTGRLAEELVRQSKLNVIVIDADAVKVDSLRRRWDAAGLYGERLSAIAADPLKAGLPPYVASLIVSEDAKVAGLGNTKGAFEKVELFLQPDGGVLCLSDPLANLIGQAGKMADEPLFIRRREALAGADSWTHEHANAGNTRSTADKLAKPPLGVLWFGGQSSVQAIAHKKPFNSTPRIAGGRMYIDGDNMLHAFDAYTGRLLWKVEFADRLQPKRTHMVTMADAVYVVDGAKLIAFRADTGQPLWERSLEAPAEWGDLYVYEDLLIVPRGEVLVAMDRSTGQDRWTRDEARPLSVAIGNGRLFCVESSAPPADESQRRGDAPDKPLLIALNVRDGSEIWRNTEGHGPQLGYSERYDVLLVADAVAYRGKDGEKLWGEASLRTPKRLSVIVDKMIFQDSQRRKMFRPINLLTGEEMTRTDPWTGEQAPWQFSRSHGCGGLLGNENMLTFRSSSAAYYDLNSKSGTTNFGGFRSGCVPNLVAADGILNAPTNIKGCTCNWPIRTSMALIHMPQLESWSTYSTYGWLDEPGPASAVRRLGLNFGAPGDRNIPDSTLWVDYPSVGGPSPEVKIRTTPESPETFRHHSLRMEGGGLKWVAASGIKGVETLTVTLDESPTAPRRFTVRLHFAEPEQIAPARRVFDISLQGLRVVQSLDVVKEAGSPRRALVKEFKGVEVSGDLTVALKAAAGSMPTILCGLEVIEENPKQEK